MRLDRCLLRKSVGVVGLAVLVIWMMNGDAKVKLIIVDGQDRCLGQLVNVDEQFKNVLVN